MYQAKASFFSGKEFESAVDDKRFFLSPLGKHNPAAEKEASIKAFLEKDYSDPDSHPRCRFPARYHFLKKTSEELQGHSFPLEKCKELSAWLESLNPHSVSLIFASAYLNNPASMFGHTFLRINPPETSHSTSLVASSASYGAIEIDPPGPIYALRGIFGFYQGVFAVEPYYRSVSKYSDIENRDIWEYELSLTPEQARFLTLILWDLKGTRFDYYFFTENCSYLILLLLEAALPQYDLNNNYSPWVVPVETLKSVMKANSLVKEIIYRPAISSIIKSRQQALCEKEIKKAEQALASKSLLDKDYSYETLSLLAELLERTRLTSPTDYGEDMRSFNLSVLRAISKLKAKPLPPVSPPDSGPQNGHDSSVIGINLGFESKQSDGFFTDLSLRPAFHSLNDNPEGYVQGAQLKFMETTFRVEEGAGPHLQKIDYLSIRSFSPAERFINPSSWLLDISTERTEFSAHRPYYLSRLEGGLGKTYGDKSYLTYMHGIVNFDYAERLTNGHNISLGAKLGTYLDLIPKIRLQGELDLKTPLSVSEEGFWKTLLSLQYYPKKNLRLGLVLSGFEEFSAPAWSTAFQIRNYF